MRTARRVTLSGVALSATLLLLGALGWQAKEAPAPQRGSPARWPSTARTGAVAAVGKPHVAGRVSRGDVHAASQRQGPLSSDGPTSVAQPAGADAIGSIEPPHSTPEPGPEVPRLTLDQLLTSAAALSVRPTGFDRRAPRAIELWRVTESGQAVVAVGRSLANGEMLFPELVVPRDGIRLVAAPQGQGPDSPAASLLRDLPPRNPEPPLVRVRAHGSGQARLRLVPVESSGEVVASDGDGQEIGRWPVRPGPHARAMEVLVPIREDAASIWLHHELSGGRRSESHAVALLPAP